MSDAARKMPDGLVSRPWNGSSGADSIFLKSAPIDPSWVLSGAPRARSGLHSASRDDSSSTSVWDCTAGSFRWSFGWDETVLILDGSVKVTSPQGEIKVLERGDIAYFAAGTTWTWEVETYVRKIAFLHRPASKVDRLLRVIRRGTRQNSTAIKVSLATVLATSLAALLAFE